MHELSDLNVLNTASYGALHNYLKDLPHYTCSEYFKDIPNGTKNDKGVFCLDLYDIKMDENTFDIIITEDVFEHLQKPQIAFSEISRVLKKDGFHIFTVPMNEKKASVNRIENPKKVFHEDGLRSEGIQVFFEFGWDMGKYIENTNEQLEFKVYHRFYSEDEITNLETDYNRYLQMKRQPLNFYKYNSVVCIQSQKQNKVRKKFQCINKLYEQVFPLHTKRRIHIKNIMDRIRESNSSNS